MRAIRRSTLSARLEPENPKKSTSLRRGPVMPGGCWGRDRLGEGEGRWRSGKSWGTAEVAGADLDKL